MAIDTRTKRGSASGFLFTITQPAADGTIDAGDRATVSWLYSGLSYTAGPEVLVPATEFSRQPFEIVKLTLEGDMSSQDFYFSTKDGPPAERLGIALGLDVRPYLTSSRGRPTKIQPDKALTERSRVTFNMVEDPNAPDFDSTVFTIFKGGEFWRRLMAANRDYIGSPIETRRGFLVGLNPDKASFATMPLIFKGRVEEIDLQTTGAVSVIAKDLLIFRDREAPPAISDTNVLTAAIVDGTDTNIDITDKTEVTDPFSLASQDFFPVLIQIESELIIIGSVSIGINRLFVADNHIDKSEKLDDALWVKSAGTTVTADVDIGPFGGERIADQIEFAAIGDELAQTTTKISGLTTPNVGSWWIRDPALADGVTSTITIQISDTGGTFFLNTVTISNKWTRFDASGTFSSATETLILTIRRRAGDTTKVLAFGGQINAGTLVREIYVPTDGNAGSDAGRGAFGTTAVGHAISTGFKEVLVYRSGLAPITGVHPAVILRDLVNRGEALLADVDQTSFDDEFTFIVNTQLKREGTNLIDEPGKLSDLIKEVRQQSLLDLWVSEEGKIKTRLSFRTVQPGVTLPLFKDEDSILQNSLAIRNNAESRITRAVVFYDLKSGAAGAAPNDFNKAQIFVDLAVEAASGAKVRTIFGKWIELQGDALALAGRLVNRFLRAARRATLFLDLKDEGTFDVGDVVLLNTVDILRRNVATNTAGRFDSPWQVVQKEPQRRESRVKIEVLEATGLRPGFISPNTPPSGTFPDEYDDADAEERQFAFISDANAQVGTDLDDAYTII